MPKTPSGASLQMLTHTPRTPITRNDTVRLLVRKGYSQNCDRTFFFDSLDARISENLFVRNEDGSDPRMTTHKLGGKRI